MLGYVAVGREAKQLVRDQTEPGVHSRLASSGGEGGRALGDPSGEGLWMVPGQDDTGVTPDWCRVGVIAE